MLGHLVGGTEANAVDTVAVVIMIAIYFVASDLRVLPGQSGLLR